MRKIIVLSAIGMLALGVTFMARATQSDCPRGKGQNPDCPKVDCPNKDCPKDCPKADCPKKDCPKGDGQSPNAGGKGKGPGAGQGKGRCGRQ